MGADRASKPADVTFSVDLESRQVTRLHDVRLSEIGIRERQDLQRWIEEHPEIVGGDLIVVTTEFDQWEARSARVADRLDVLFLDSVGSLLVAELKRDAASETTDLQALKYAAYCSQLRVSDVVEMYARYHDVSVDDARTQLFDHAPALEDDELGKVRIRLVAAGFSPSISAVVLWLIDSGLDVGCIEIKASLLPDRVTATVTARQVLPPPSAEEYLVRRRLKKVEDEEREARSRRRDSVVILLEHEAVARGTEVKLKLEEFTGPQKRRVSELLRDEPLIACATWTGLSAREALEWRFDGETYSPTSLVKKILSAAGIQRRAVPGPRYWCLPDGATLAERAVELEGGESEPAADPATS